MREDGIGTARQHCGHFLAVEIKGTVTYRIDPQVDSVQSPLRGTLPDAARAQAGPFKLSEGDEPVLPASSLSDCIVLAGAGKLAGRNRDYASRFRPIDRSDWGGHGAQR
jgi:hypothetical protein